MSTSWYFSCLWRLSQINNKQVWFGIWSSMFFSSGLCLSCQHGQWYTHIECHTLSAIIRKAPSSTEIWNFPTENSYWGPISLGSIPISICFFFWCNGIHMLGKLHRLETEVLYNIYWYILEVMLEIVVCA